MGVQNVKAIFKKESSQQAPIATITELECQKCGGKMMLDKVIEKKPIKIIFGFFLIFFGLIIIISTAGVGLPVAVIVFVIAGILMKSKRTSMWKCGTCGYYFNCMK